MKKHRQQKRQKRRQKRRQIQQLKDRWPSIFVQWLKQLPPDDQDREFPIAVRNTALIAGLKPPPEV
jgi:hypothetical protein